MATHAWVGRRTHRSSVEAAREAAGQAARALGGGPADLCLLYATERDDQDAILAEVRDVFPGARISGCSAEGVIAGSTSEESEFVLAVLAATFFHRPTCGLRS